MLRLSTTLSNQLPYIKNLRIICNMRKIVFRANVMNNIEWVKSAGGIIVEVE